MDRINNLKKLKLDSYYEEQVQEHIALEIKQKIEEYINAFNILKNYLSEGKEIYNYTIDDIKNSLLSSNRDYKDSMKYFKIKGYIDNNNRLSPEGLKLLGRVFLNKSMRDPIDVNELSDSFDNNIEPLLNDNLNVDGIIDKELHDNFVETQKSDNLYDFFKTYLMIEEKKKIEPKKNNINIEGLNKDDPIENFIYTYIRLKNKDKLPVEQMKRNIQTQKVKDELVQKKPTENRGAYSEYITQMYELKNKISDLEKKVDMYEQIEVNEIKPDRNTMVCPRCRREVPKNEYCEICGNKLSATNMNQVNMNSQKVNAIERI